MPTGKMKTKLNGGLESPILANVKTKKEKMHSFCSAAEFGAIPSV